jgi:hypothetical protein
MPFQSQEVAEWEEGERKDSIWRYLPVSYDAQRDYELVSSFQPSFEMKARLTSFMLLIHKPPIALEVQIEFHDLRERFLAFLRRETPQEIFEHLIQLAANTFRKQKSAYGIRGNGSSH